MCVKLYKLIDFILTKWKNNVIIKGKKKRGIG